MYKAGKNPTRASYMNALLSLNSTNRFLLNGVKHEDEQDRPLHHQPDAAPALQQRLLDTRSAHWSRAVRARATVTASDPRGDQRLGQRSHLTGLTSAGLKLGPVPLHRRQATGGDAGSRARATLTARTIASAGQSSPTSSTFTQPGACSKWPRNMRSPVSAWDRIARLTPPWRTARTVSQLVVGEQPVDSRKHAIEELADRLPAEEALVERDDAAKRVHELLLELRRPGSPKGVLPAARAVRATPRPRGCERTISAVSTVRGSPLDSTRSKCTPASSLARPRPARRPVVVQADARLGRPACRPGGSTTPRHGASGTAGGASRA